MSEQKTARPTVAEIRAVFDRVATMTTCGSPTYCVCHVPPEIAAGLSMVEEALGWVLGHKDSADGFGRLLKILKSNQPSEEVLHYDIGGDTTEKQTEAMMTARGFNRAKPVSLDEMLRSIIPPGSTVVPVTMNDSDAGPLLSAILASLTSDRSGKKDKNPAGSKPERKGGDIQ